MYKQD